MPIPKIRNAKYRVKKSSAGLGLFAVEPIKRGTWIIEYVGKVLHISDATASRYLGILEKEGRIKQVGTAGRWVSYTKV